MKCEHCGNNLGLEDLVCPYCGTENKMAKQHNTDMKRFSADYASTKQDVISNSRRFNAFTVRITIIAVLVTLIAVMVIALCNSYDIRSARQEKIIAANENKYRDDLDKLIDERDYLGLSYYSRINNIRYSDSLEDLYMIFTVSSVYESFMHDMYYLFDDDSYMDDEEAFERIAESMDRIYSYRDPNSEYEKNKYYTDGRVYDYIYDLSVHMETLIKGYFNLSDEDIESFDELSNAKKQILLEDGYHKDRL
ncbi:MAG: zinc ribbon domain-containing protein [Lachnospiraceae bacterium]|nr:zinc ribbon domain-containing protein [Lachnospiraceae bacterium]